MKKLCSFTLIVLLIASSTLFAQSFKGKNVRVVIGSTSTSGDSYLIAEVISRYLAKELNANMKVDAVGAARALETIRTARPDGNTIMIFHDMTYLGISFGAYDSMYTLENMVVGPRAVQNPGAAWAASKNAPYNTMAEIPEYLKKNPNAICRMALEAGGVSHVGFVVYYQWVLEKYGKSVADRIRVILGGSTGDKCQLLWDGNCDVIFADYTSLLDYTKTDDSKIAMKFVGLMDNVDGLSVPSYADQGITLAGNPFKFSKDFLLYLPKNFPASLTKELDNAMQKVCANPQFQADLGKMFYRSSFMKSSDAKTFIYSKRDNLEPVIKNSPNLDMLVYKR